MKKLTVVIVSYNVKHYLEQCITSLQWALRGIDAEIIVVDNHSRDGSPEYIRKKFGKNITLIASKHNLGFSKANNLAIRQSQSEYVLLLNPDTIVTEEAMRQVLTFMDEHPCAGAAGVRMLKTDGSDAKESRRGIPSPMTSLYKMCGLCSLFPKSQRFGHYYMSDISWDEPHQIEIISGAFCIIRRQALDQIGLLDEDFFMYGEDIDLSYRILEGGWENWYIPAVILHYKGESTHKSSFRYVHVFYDAMLIFFRKHYSHLSLLISIPIKIAVLLKATMALINIGIKESRDSIGLRARKKNPWPHFIFIGSEFMIKQCQRIAHDSGLDAEFHEGTIGTCPEGHNNLSIPEDRSVVVVYDVHAYSYESIFWIFAKNPRRNVTIGTYDSRSRRIITENEVIEHEDYDENE